jgi:hypothetical protein
LEARLSGRQSVSHDIDPLAVLIIRCKTSRLSRNAADRLVDQVDRALNAVTPHDRDRSEAAITHASPGTPERLRVEGLWLPRHPNLTHWYSDTALRDLAILRDAVAKIPLAGAARRLTRLAFAKVCRAASNADPVPASGLEVTSHYRARVERKPRVNNPIAQFRRTVAEFAGLVAELSSETSSGRHTATLRNAAVPYRGPVRRCRVVITSPPYGVAVDYARRHSLEHYWLGDYGGPAGKIKLGRKYIGRTARRGGRPVRIGGRGPVAAEVVRQMRDQPAAANAFDDYCAAMTHALRNAARGLDVGGLAVFVVGASVWAGVSIPADRLLAELGRDRFTPDHTFTYPVRNRHMSYARRNGANIDREIVLALRKTKA